LLPDGIEEVLPEKARRLEKFRRLILDLFYVWGYELVMPPMVEFLDSLLTGAGSDMDLQTFKVTDQISGRMMGIRPDMTPQAARIDAHYLKKDVPVRLCYTGPVLRTRPDNFAGSREPLQLGAELFGHTGRESELEVLQLMATMLIQIGVEHVHIELGHVGIFRSLAKQANLSLEQESELFTILQKKAEPDMDALLANWDLSGQVRKDFAYLVNLNGDVSILENAKNYFSKNKIILACLAEVQDIYDGFMKANASSLPVLFDLAELSGYGYYTGIVFSAFIPGHGRAIANGGRYDGVGASFGRNRPATGFGADLRELINLISYYSGEASAIMAPLSDDKELKKVINDLRKEGERVIMQLPGGNTDAVAMGCDKELVKSGNKWTVKNI